MKTKWLLTILGIVLLTIFSTPILYLGAEVSQLGFSPAIELLTSNDTVSLLAKSLLLASAVAICACILGVGAALLSYSDMPGARFFSVAYSLPLALPSYIAALAYLSFLQRDGLLDQMTGYSFISPHGYVAAFIVLSICTYPYVYLTVRGFLAGFDARLIEAAQSLGLSRKQAILSVLIPNLKKPVLASLLLVILYALSDFGAVSLLRAETFTEFIYNRHSALSADIRNEAALLALVLLVIAICLLLTESRMSRNSRWQTSRAVSTRPLSIQLGSLKYPALIVSLLFFAIAILLPIAELAHWVLQPERVELLWSEYIQICLSTLKYGAMAALAALVVAGLISYLAVRQQSALAKFIERWVYLGFSIPGIVVGFACLRFGFFWDRQFFQVFSLNNSVSLLCLAYLIRFIPQATGSISSSLTQCSPKFEDAARSLGYSKLGAISYVTMPMILPGLQMAALLVFLTTIKELPTTMLLIPPGDSTLALNIWAYSEEAFFAKAAIPSLLLLVLAGVPMTLKMTLTSRFDS